MENNIELDENNKLKKDLEEKINQEFEKLP
jgi:hypothetical protein